MSDSLSNIPLQANTWVDLYATSGISVGTQLVIENVGNADIYLTVQAAMPDQDHDSYNVIKRPPSVNMQNTEGDSGAWAYSPNTNGKIAVSPQIKTGFQPVTEARLLDGFGNPINSLKNALNVHVADVHNIPVNDFIHSHGVSTTLAQAADAGDTQISVADATGFNVGEYVHMGPIPIPIEPIHPRITVQDIPGGVITLDRPLDFAYANGSNVTVSIVNLITGSAAATLANPISFFYHPHLGTVEHITRLLFEMIQTTAGSDDRFGGIPALINGVVIRATINGQTGTFTNWKDNGDIRLDMFDVEYSDKVGGGNFGTSGRGSFSRIGVVIRLDSTQGDFVEILVQDDLEALVDFRIKMQGHIEGA